MCLPEIEIVPESLKCLTRIHWVARRIAQSAGHNQHVARVLIEKLVRLEVECVSDRVPNDPIDARYLAGGFSVRQRTSKANQKDGLARRSCRIDRTVKWY